MYRDFAVASVLGLRRRLQAVVDVLDSILKGGVSLARSLELTSQRDRILRIGPVGPVTKAEDPCNCNLYLILISLSKKLDL